jgi:hypothetical protein
MKLTARDRKILLAILPLAVIVGFWFLVLAPKRQEAAQAGEELAKQQQRLDTAEQSIQPLESAKASFASDYTQLVRLGKAVPTKVDMPTVVVQLEQAAKGTGITFTRIATGERIPAATPAPAAPGAPAAPQGGAAPGGQPAASGPGQAAETAGNQVNNANQQSAGAEQQSGAQPSGGQAATPAGAAAPAGSGAAPAGLDRVTLELEFEGSFFRLAAFFHDLKRFVRAANNRIEVRGRLLTVESLNFLSDPEIFPRLRADVGATIYLAPQAQGQTAGATAQGPAPASAPAGGAAPAPAAPNPTATATP